MLEDDAPQIITLLECSTLITSTNYFLHFFWNYDLFQPAVVEAFLGYFLDVFRKRNVFQITADAEHPLSDLLQLVRQAYILQALAFIKCPVTYFSELGTLLESNTPQILTAAECTIEKTAINYFLHISWDHDLLEPAVAEEAWRDFFSVFRKRNALQTAAFEERAFSDFPQL